jgi:hypothetical protein
LQQRVIVHVQDAVEGYRDAAEARTTAGGLEDGAVRGLQGAAVDGGNRIYANNAGMTLNKEDSSGNGANWRTLDILEELVSFESTGRVSKTLVKKKNGQPTTKKSAGGLVENVVLSGAIVPRGIFGAKAQPKFDWEHWETRSGRRIAVIGYRAVGENYSDGKTRYELQVAGQIIFDDTAGDLVRTESSSVGPRGYPFGETRVETDYAPMTISDRELILPTKAVMTTVRGKRRYQSEIQFSGYRKYHADTTIRFDNHDH